MTKFNRSAFLIGFIGIIIALVTRRFYFAVMRKFSFSFDLFFTVSSLILILIAIVRIPDLPLLGGKENRVNLCRLFLVFIGAWALTYAVYFHAKTYAVLGMIDLVVAWKILPQWDES